MQGALYKVAVLSVVGMTTQMAHSSYDNCHFKDMLLCAFWIFFFFLWHSSPATKDMVLVEICNFYLQNCMKKADLSAQIFLHLFQPSVNFLRFS